MSTLQRIMHVADSGPGVLTSGAGPSSSRVSQRFGSSVSPVCFSRQPPGRIAGSSIRVLIPPEPTLQGKKGVIPIVHVVVSGSQGQNFATRLEHSVDFVNDSAWVRGILKNIAQTHHVDSRINQWQAQ